MAKEVKGVVNVKTTGTRGSLAARAGRAVLAAVLAAAMCVREKENLPDNVKKC